MTQIETPWMLSYIGKVLASACRADYMIDGKLDSIDFGPLQLDFTDQTCLVFELVPDGQSVCVGNAQLRFPNPTPNECVWHRLELGDDSWKALALNPLTSIDEWIWDDIVRVGFRLHFGDHWICYWNAGDDAHCSVDELPTWPVGICRWRTLAPENYSR
jgi:hypothetical protein